MKPFAKETWRFAADAVLRSYAVVFFAEDRVTGLLLLLATCLAPGHGLIGLCGVLVTIAAALGLGFDPAAVRKGHYSFNSLLTALALAHLNALHPLGPGALALLLVAAAVLTLFVSVSMMHAMSRLHLLPCLSLPFVAVSLPLYLLFGSAAGGTTGDAQPLLLLASPDFLPAGLRVFLESFGAIFFVPHAAAGALIVLALLRHSRLAVLFAGAAYAGGSLLLQQLGLDAGAPFRNVFLGFNFIVTGIALGSVYFIPSRGSLLLAVLGAFFCALIGLATKAFLGPHGIPPLAIPFNAAVLIALAALRHRTTSEFIPGNRFDFAKPEENLQAHHTARARFPDAHLPAIAPPFFGERVVTQAVGGPITHAGAWQHALDFEVLDAAGGRFTGLGARLEDFHTFNTPVLAPGDGTVVRVCDHIEDNAIGRNNLDDNWGNHVVILLDAGPCAMLCHFRKGGIVVHLGQRVARSAILGYCGNSGRSPVPHLHVNLQALPEPGAPTLPFRLLHYVRFGTPRCEYVFSGLPVQDERIKAAEFDPHLSAFFEGFEDARWRYRISGDGPDREEAVVCSTASNGDYLFQSLSLRATLTARVVDRVFCAIDFQGDARSVLFAFRLGLGRVPFTSEQDVSWTDHLALRPLLRPAARLVLDLVQPFLGCPMLTVTGRLAGLSDFAGQHGALCVVAEMDPRTIRPPVLFRPQRVEVFLANQQGIVGARVQHEAGECRIERIA